MNNSISGSIHKHLTIIGVLALAVFALLTIRPIADHAASADDKLTPKEIIAKHLEAIGPEKARAAIKNRVMAGEATFQLKGGRQGELKGPVLMASDDKKVLVGINFGHTSYPFEQLGYDGRKMTVAYHAPGQRSSLGNFLITEDVPFREGLFGSVLSSAWPLLDPTLNNSKIEYAGSRKINGRQVEELRYYPRKGADSQIKLSFDAETFQHVRTEYTKVISAQLGRTADQSAQQRETRYNFTEEFGDFKKEGGLVLPHSYKLELVVAGRGPTYTAQWTLNFNGFQFNQQIPADSFNVERAASAEKR